MNKSSCLIDQERDLRTCSAIVYLHADCWAVRNGNVSNPLQLLLALVLMIVPLQTRRLSHPSLWSLVCNSLAHTDFFFSVIFCLAYSQSICPLNCSSLALTLQASVEISREDRVVRLHVFSGAITSGRMAYLGRGRLMFAPHSVCNYFCRVHSLAMNLFILLQEFKTLPLLLIPHHLMGFWVLGDTVHVEDTRVYSLARLYFLRYKPKLTLFPRA